MGATTASSNTLADYLISIRTRPKERRRRHSFVKRQAPAVTGDPPAKLQRRSLAQEIWNVAPSNNNEKKRQSHATTIDANRTKRTKRLPSNGTSKNTSRSMETSSARCTLQPLFTKESAHDQHAKHHLVQYRFEFSRNVLEEISLNERNAVFESSDLSVISQITQDSSLLEPIDEEKETYFYSSESDEGSDIECMSSDDESSSSSSSMNTTYYHRNSGRPTEIKTAEVKEGAQLLLDLFSM